MLIKQLIWKKKNLLFFHMLIFIYPLTSIAGNNHLFVLTNKVTYVAGEQLLFDVLSVSPTGNTSDNKDYFLSVDFVSPDGDIVESQTLIKITGTKLFFPISESLKTGVYRLIANSPGMVQVIKRIHIYALDMAFFEQEKAISHIDFEISGGHLISGISNKIATRVVGSNGVGIKISGTIVDSKDSVVQFLETDLNGAASFNFIPIDTLYEIRFSNKKLSLQPEFEVPFYSNIEYVDNMLVINFELKPKLKDSVMYIRLDGEEFMAVEIPSDLFQYKVSIPKEKIGFGIHELTINNSTGFNQNWKVFNKPEYANTIKISDKKISVNESANWNIEDGKDSINALSVSIIDSNLPFNYSTDFYEELYFDQYGLDLLYVEDRDFETYMLLFSDKIQSEINSKRLALFHTSGIMKYKKDNPHGIISFLDINSLEPIEMYCEDIYGLYDLQSEIRGNKVQVLPNLLINGLNLDASIDLFETVNYKYASLQSVILMDEKIIRLMQLVKTQSSIANSYKTQFERNVYLGKPDYEYILEDYDIPNTMLDLINHVIKFLSVKKKGDDGYELSLYQYMTVYKYPNEPLILLDNLPVYDSRTILNMDPKDFKKIEVRNSKYSNRTLRNFGLNGTASFYLKEDIEHPLSAKYKKLPFIEKRQNFNSKPILSEYAPDFRHQLTWKSYLKKDGNSFNIEIQASDLITSYDIQITAFMKDGSVSQSKSNLSVE